MSVMISFTVLSRGSSKLIFSWLCSDNNLLTQSLNLKASLVKVSNCFFCKVWSFLDTTFCLLISLESFRFSNFSSKILLFVTADVLLLCLLCVIYVLEIFGHLFLIDKCKERPREFQGGLTSGFNLVVYTNVNSPRSTQFQSPNQYPSDCQQGRNSSFITFTGQVKVIFRGFCDCTSDNFDPSKDSLEEVLVDIDTS